MKKEFRILILEDNPSDSDLMETELRRAGISFVALRVDNAAAFEQALDEFRPDLILADYTLPSFDGISALELVRQNFPGIPFIAVSGIMGHDLAAQMLRSGATAYVAKDDIAALAPAVMRALSEARLQRGPEGPAVVPAHDRHPGKTSDTEEKKVLVIDDDQNLRKTLSDILTEKGYQTISAASGAEGLTLLSRDFVNIAIIDLGLPDMPGIDVMKRAKELSPRTEVMIISGNATLDSAIEATNRGAFSYLLKPYEIDQLLLHMARAIDKQQTDARMVKQSETLQRSNSELRALYEISRTLSRTIDMEDLLHEVLLKITDIGMFSVERKGCIFLVEGDNVRLVSCVGLAHEAMKPCMHLRLNECLCGMAASTGQMIVSRNSDLDSRHTIRSDNVPGHGHIIVPLKAVDRMTGVLCLYISPDTEIDIRVLHLLLSLGNEIGIAIANAKIHEEAKSSSLRDPLTGLANRRLMDMMLPKFIAQAGRFRRDLSVIMLDIDHFKDYNDTYGHVAGDELLSKAGAIISTKTRRGDLAVRYGGEEFLIVIHGVDIKGACIFAETLRKTFETELKITISLGVAQYSEKLSRETGLIERADAALYRAKQNGRNRVEMDQ